ncbi:MULTISPECIES: hypothetical protein [unclassified Sphingobium]|uniref:phage tail tip fiber protein n=1 Tax=unclassified Sphingobium TaxID=2611147 RepID=UPI0022259DEE|nr:MULTISPECIES: hypothetical protein [unclassified Sphingobium]MCW2412944.1 hypothetical protein [Sphingobium sp. B8D3D]MCW2414758.1 hypothetical protein [Sphingobium sp. B8D3A]
MSALDTFSGGFRIFDGNADVTTGAGAAYSVANQIDCTVAIDPNTGRYTVSAVDQDNATAVFRAVYAGVSIYKDFSIAKSREAGGAGTAKLLTLATTHNTFPYDEYNQPAPQTATFTATKQNTTATLTWRIRKIDTSIIAEGTAANLVAGGYATSSANANTLVIDHGDFHVLCNDHGINAIMVEVECIDGSQRLADRLTVFRLIQRTKVTWEGVLDPTGAKAETVANAYKGVKDSGLVFLDLQQQALDKIESLAKGTLNQINSDAESIARFSLEQGQRLEFAVRLADAESQIVEERTARVGETAALAFSRDEILARLDNVAGTGTTIEAVMTELRAADVSQTEARVLAIDTLTARFDNYRGTGQSIEAATIAIAESVVTERDARATAITGVQTELGGQITGVQTTLSTTNDVLDGVKNRWTVALNAGGTAIAGLVFANGSATKATFDVVDTNFRVVDSSGNGSVPFSVIGGVTYIQNASILNASITNAKIANAAIDEWKLANNSTSVTAGNYTDGNISLSPTQNVYTSVQSFSISTSGGPVLLGASFNALSGTGSVQVIKFQILRNGNVIYDSRNDQAQNGYGTPKNVTMIDYPGGGSHSYGLQLTHPTLSYASGAVVSNRSLWGNEFKR